MQDLNKVVRCSLWVVGCGCGQPETGNQKPATNNQKPTIEVEFLEPAILTSAALVTKDKTKRTNLQFDTQLSKKVNVIVPAAMQNGEYLLELNAKNEKGILMDKAYTDTIVIDNQKPSLEILPKDQSALQR